MPKPKPETFIFRSLKEPQDFYSYNPAERVYFEPETESGNPWKPIAQFGKIAIAVEVTFNAEEFYTAKLFEVYPAPNLNGAELLQINCRASESFAAAAGFVAALEAFMQAAWESTEG